MMFLMLFYRVFYSRFAENGLLGRFRCFRFGINYCMAAELVDEGSEGGCRFAEDVFFIFAFLVFIAGFFFGGAFEYLCSVFTEVFFGMKFWDYSYMPFNIDGRTNLLFMFFWGIVALVWFKFIYPPFSKFIEKIPPVT